MWFKKKIKSIFFPEIFQKILSGPSCNMRVSYDVNHRFQHLTGIYEREIYKFLKKGMSNADVLIDIGANDGYYVLAFLKSGKKVIACEPGEVVAEMIHNAALNGFNEGDKFIIDTRCVGSGPGHINPGELIKQHPGRYFFLVDIDGGEDQLLESCGTDFPFHKTSWLIETHSQELENKCCQFLQTNNYSVTIIKNAWWRKFIPELRPLEHNRWLYAQQV